MDIIIHQAFIIPPLSEKRPNWAWEINVEGTRNLLKAARESQLEPGIVFTSSISVYGKTQDLAPPRNIAENVQPTDNYSHHKVACEQLVRVSGLKWTILRLGKKHLPAHLFILTGWIHLPARIYWTIRKGILMILLPI